MRGWQRVFGEPGLPSGFQFASHPWRWINRLAARKAASFGVGGFSAVAMTSASSRSERRMEQVVSGNCGRGISGLPLGGTPVSVLSILCLLSLHLTRRRPLINSAPRRFHSRTRPRTLSSWIFSYLLLDPGLSLVPRFTIFLTHPTVILDSHSGATQITFEWYLPHLSRSRNARV